MVTLVCACSSGEFVESDAGGDGDLDATEDSGRPDADLEDSGPPDASEDSSPPDSSHPDADDAEPDGGGPDADEGDAAPVDGDVGDSDLDGGEMDAGGDGGLTAAACFDEVFSDTSMITLDYDSFGPVIGSHCLGTNHQDIVGVERIVFLGDSVTVGSPPTLREQFYRSRLAEELSWHFALDPPGELWEMVNWFEGMSLSPFSGDFACCAKWGARTDDLLRDHSQIEDCFPEDERHKTTLVIMTIGGNDVASITQDGIDGVPVEEIWEETREFVGLMRDAVEWFYEDPTRFPGGVFVVFANMFEFTDGTGDTAACPAASLAGFGAEWEDPDALAEMVIWANEQYMSIAVDNGKDRDPVWVRVACFDKTAELAAQYLAKGRQCAVEGRLSTSRWETQGGEKRERLDVTAFRVHFVSDGQQQRRDDEHRKDHDTGSGW